MPQALVLGSMLARVENFPQFIKIIVWVVPPPLILQEISADLILASSLVLFGAISHSPYFGTDFVGTFA